MSDTRVVQIVGGSHDGTEYALRPDQRDLRLPRLTVPSWQDISPLGTVAYVVEVYGPATEADRMLGRWSLLRTERP